MNRVRVVVALLFASLCWISCSSEDGSRAKKPDKPKSEFSEYAIHVFAEREPGVQVELAFPPVEAISTIQGTAVLPGSPGSKPQILVEADGGQVQVDPPFNPELDAEPGWLLLMRAVHDCAAPNNLHRFIGAITPPWAPDPAGADSWYVFKSRLDDPGAFARFGSCEEIAAMEHVLLCAADKLQEIADTVAPVVWDKTVTGAPYWFPDSQAVPSFMSWKWTIVPQNSKDKFVVRDLALNVLANLARLDLERPYSDATAAPHLPLPAGETCADAWVSSGWSQSGQAYFDDHYQTIYDVSTKGIKSDLDDLAIDDASRTLNAEVRLRHVTQILRTAGRMTRTLIDDSVMADLSGAERQRGKATDTYRGPALYWGAETDSTGPYNSLTHAFRVMFGRWESNRFPDWAAAPSSPTEARIPSGDPECGGYESDELLPSCSPSMSARVEDQRARKPAQEFATSIVDRAGIVIPDGSPGGIGAIKTAVANQLILTAAKEQNYTISEPKFAERAQAITKMVEGIDDADLRFAMDRNVGAYRLLTGAPPGTPVPASDPAGITLLDTGAGEVDSSVLALGGHVLKNGMPRLDVIGDHWARVGPGASGSQCEELQPASVPEGSANVGKTLAFQSSFMIGEVLRRRLSQIAALTTPAGWSHPQTSFPELADKASAELRTWTGPGLVMFRSVEGRALEVRITGLTPADLGVPTAADMKKRIRAVWGKPWVADCATGQRKSCGALFEQNHLSTPTFEQVNGEITGYDDYTGSDGRVLSLQFDLLSGPTNFNPTFTSQGTAPDMHVYLVAAGDPKNPVYGKVLAPLALRDVGPNWSFALISDYQRKLANDLFGVSHEWSAHGNKLGKESTSKPPGYCLGLPKDFFVPLENELTSDSDGFESSWKHYLSAAAEAAARADQLGQQLIEQGLQTDMRREAAQEEVGKICGDYGAASKVKVEGGEVKPTSDNSTINSCISEDNWDVVFLTGLPPEDQMDDAAIRTKYLGCVTGDNRPVCGNDITPAPALEKTGLNLVPWYDPDNESPPVTAESSCTASMGLVSSLATGFDGSKVQSALGEDSFDAAEMGSVVQALNVELDGELQWKVAFDNNLLMSTEDDGYWPKCGSSCIPPASPPAPPPTPGELQAEKLRSIFGTAPVATAQDRNAAFERVAGTLWFMAAASGHLPEGMFRLPIPARDDYEEIPPNPPPDPELAPVIYGKGKFDSSLLLDISGGLFDDDQKLVGKAENINPAFMNALAASNSRPAWVKDVYTRASSTPFRHILTSNAARQFPDQPALGAWLIAQGKRVSKVKELSATSCDEAPLSAAELSKAKTEMANLKYPKKAGVLCTTPDGKTALLYAQTSGTSVRDIYEYYNGDHPRKITDIIPYNKDSGGSRGEARENPAFYGDEAYSCKHSVANIGGHTVAKVAHGCLNNTGTQGYPLPDHLRFTLRALSPVGCPPAGRAQLFIDWNTPVAKGCNVAREISSAMALTCVLGSAYRAMGKGDPLPALTKPDDIPKLETWLDDQADRVKISLSRLHLVNVPKRVVEEQKAGQVGVGSYAGEHGLLVLQYRQHLNTFATNWLGMEKELHTIRSAISTAHNQLTISNLAKDEALANIAMQEIQLHASIAKGMLAAAGGVAKLASPKPDLGGAFEAGQAAIDVAAATAQLGVLKDLKSIQDKKKAAAVQGIMITLKEQTSQSYTNLQQLIEAMQTAVAGAHQTASQLEQKENEAKYHLAKASGADYVVDSNGNVIEFPVNTVQRRMYDITKRRYEAALKDAKYLAYMARLAIEQRIGLRLEDVTEGVGTLEAPHQWANDVCHFVGVNYDSLRKGNTPDAGVFSAIMDAYYAKYADPFIGDYVTKLQNFVEFYNIEYPSHEGDDVAVLSIRDDLLGPGGRCYRPSRNLLFHSSDLTRAEADDDEGTNLRGWQRNACESTDAYCLSVMPGSVLTKDALTPPTPLPKPGYAPTEGWTWLRETAMSEMLSSPAPQEPSQPPTRAVYQAVDLAVGSYALSWHDMARDPIDPAVTPPTADNDYTVAVYDANWAQIASFTGKPHVLTTDDPWSERHVIPFTTQSAGTHYVAFSASVKGAATQGSVAIANVQLEQASAAETITGYEETGSSLLVITGDCAAGDPQRFRNAFDYVCNDKTCYYELRKAFAVDIRTLVAGYSPLAGKIAQDNFNYRHLSTALNVVGTGVIDCSKAPTASCYGSPYVEYTFEHDAFASLAIDYHGFPRPFNFGSAGIRYGKALAAERFVTLPMGTSDQAFFSQPEFRKIEFMGRPLDGNYRLRVYDNPALNWTKVEDIQLVMNYRYWSRVAKESQQN